MFRTISGNTAINLDKVYLITKDETGESPAIILKIVGVPDVVWYFDTQKKRDYIFSKLNA